jgi:ATP citrate (pro-S)-lyase
MGGCKGPITTFIVEPFIPHNEEFYLNIVSDRLGNSVSFSECGGIDIEENWDKVLQQILSSCRLNAICALHV